MARQRSSRSVSKLEELDEDGCVWAVAVPPTTEESFTAEERGEWCAGLCLDRSQIQMVALDRPPPSLMLLMGLVMVGAVGSPGARLMLAQALLRRPPPLHIGCTCAESGRADT